MDIPSRQGLYDPAHEHDACGVGFVAHIKNQKSHAIVKQGLEILDRLTHRGATGYDPLLGDGAGILIQLPDAFLREEAARLGITLPAAGAYGCGNVFLPQSTNGRIACESALARIVHEEGQRFLGWRDVPRDNSGLAQAAKDREPVVRQVFIASNCADQDAFERKLFVIRKRVEHEVRRLGLEDGKQFYIPTLSSRTLNYKGMLLAHQVGEYFLDLRDERMVSAIALVHQRFSTNTFPTWDLAHPFRMIAHNGEINTVRGNINWMAARQKAMASKWLGEDLDKLWPLIVEGQSDSASFDNALELLVMGGYSLPHAMMMLIPEAWAGNPLMDEERRAFYEFHAPVMEPWDGPAAVAFTDGRQIGATLDRNGLRPARYLVTDDGIVMMASEMGVLTFAEDKIAKKWRLQPGKMFLIDLEEGRIIDDEELKKTLATEEPYRQWIEESRVFLSDLPPVANEAKAAPKIKPSLLDAQQAFGYSQEDVKFILEPMIKAGEEPTGSMGADTALPVLSSKNKSLYLYFKQLFAQVTNPPIDAIREEIVMSLTSFIGPKPNLLGIADVDESLTPRLEVHQPVLAEEDCARLRDIEKLTKGRFKSLVLDITYPVADGAAGCEKAMAALAAGAEQSVADGYNIVILSDRNVSAERVPVPALLACAGVHHHLVRKGLRTSTGLVVDSGSVREVHHFALLAGYGAEAVCPWLTFATIKDLVGKAGDSKAAVKNYIKAIGKGLNKVMSKMGISTYQSYCGAQIFEAIGLNRELIDRYFTGTSSRVEGVGIREIGEETLRRHRVAYEPAAIRQLDFGGEIHYRIQGEHHNWNPETIYKLQHASRSNDPKTYAEFAQVVNDESKRRSNLRGLLDFKFDPQPIPIEEVEPAKEIVKRFNTGAMSFGSISKEAHETLAIAMNRLGGKSNTGEGGEDPERFLPLPNGDSKNSYIKQVASARFGVTAHYLVNARELQIKMAQGAKPGEGGQLPGHKVDENIARFRYATPGVQLISPPPHHDIYSIEDLAQLIFDLKNSNPDAGVSVKLVSEVGVGTVAAGVAKAHADKVLISGDSGGTGASPLSSIKYAGIPWELGLAETHQTLVLNDLRGRIRVETDGQMKTGRDVVIATLLGAEEYGFATAPLIVEGCIMMRKCHLNTCPVGIATQDPELRKKFNGKPEHIVNYLFFVAEEARQLMAKLGFRTINEMVGRVDKLKITKAVDHWKAKGLDLTPLLTAPEVPAGVPRFCVQKQDHGLADILDNTLVERCKAAIEKGEKVTLDLPIRNINRTTGTVLSSKIAKKYGPDGLPEDTISIKFSGSAGQSFGAFLAKGITLTLEGESNDYIGKGLSGGKIIVFPPKNILYNPEETILIGNTSLYGATQGEAYFYGMAGERFAVRNSGAQTVVEGTGDHGCEYMTGGVVVVLGMTGRNFAAGMSGGVAFVLDDAGTFQSRCNTGMVELETVTTKADKQLLHGLLTKHFMYTGSRKAKQVLDAFDATVPKFVKVMPVDYKRVLEERKRKASAVH